MSEAQKSQPPNPALTNCPICGGIVSTSAEACPHCGHPIAELARQAARQVARQEKAEKAKEQWEEFGKNADRIMFVIVRLCGYFSALFFLSCIAYALGVFTAMRPNPTFETLRDYGWTQLWFHALAPLFVHFPMVFLARKMLSERAGYAIGWVFQVLMGLAIPTTLFQLLDMGAQRYVLPVFVVMSFWLFVVISQIRFAKKALPSGTCLGNDCQTVAGDNPDIQTQEASNGVA